MQSASKEPKSARWYERSTTSEELCVAGTRRPDRAPLLSKEDFQESFYTRGYAGVAKTKLEPGIKAGTIQPALNEQKVLLGKDVRRGNSSLQVPGVRIWPLSRPKKTPKNLFTPKTKKRSTRSRRGRKNTDKTEEVRPPSGLGIRCRGVWRSLRPQSRRNPPRHKRGFRGRRLPVRTAPLSRASPWVLDKPFSKPLLQARRQLVQ
jgi:hypothetical protein